MCEALRELMAEDLKDAEKKGIGKGIEQGIEQGIDLRDREKITNMLNKGKTPNEIVEFCDYPMELVLEVQDKLVNNQKDD
ncbi:hypothetical protein [Butyrivibrio proteoclasticus]|uniref:hypothetical protein n=1 Tax=Butyrivibrio proteoclasticus TaxID=43305 RepID=UPI00047D9197|nr:hypothetical protein [Butyrivibrio proteoclasticus]